MKLMHGKPLIDYTIEYAMDCPLINEVFVSTDSEEIAAHAGKKGVKAIIRSSQLCGNVAIVDVLKHAVMQTSDPDKITHVVALQADHPDRTVNLTDLLKFTLERDIADTITIEADGVRHGSIRILRKKDLMENRISYSIMAVRDECTNIHHQKDFDRAAANIEKRLMIKNG